MSLGRFDSQSRIVLTRDPPRSAGTEEAAQTVMRGGVYLTGGVSFDDFCQVNLPWLCECPPCPEYIVVDLTLRFLSYFRWRSHTA